MIEKMLMRIEADLEYWLEEVEYGLTPGHNWMADPVHKIVDNLLALHKIIHQFYCMEEQEKLEKWICDDRRS